MKFSEFLNESPLPDQWDKNKYKGRLDFRSMINYAQEKSKELGAGSSRVAFLIKHDGKDSALKIAKNPKGVAQNEQEVKYLSDSSLKKLNILIPLIDYDKENHRPRWVHTEFAEKIGSNYFEKETGLSLKDFVLYVYREVHVNPKNADKQSELKKEIKEDSKLLKSLRVLFTEHKDLEYGDLGRIENWGLYNGNAVILDIGLDSTSIQTYRLKK